MYYQSIQSSDFVDISIVFSLDLNYKKVVPSYEVLYTSRKIHRYQLFT